MDGRKHHHFFVICRVTIKRKKYVIETPVAIGGGSKGLTLTGLSRTLASGYGRGFREPSEF